jgi:hypothetical protein
LNGDGLDCDSLCVIYGNNICPRGYRGIFVNEVAKVINGLSPNDDYNVFPCPIRIFYSGRMRSGAIVCEVSPRIALGVCTAIIEKINKIRKSSRVEPPQMLILA